MPIYAYKCGSCGHAKDVLQKLSDAPLTVCPACGAAAFSKQLTAAGFQLKGSGWYVTDFRGGSNGAPKEAGGAGEGAGKPAESAGKPAEGTKPAEGSKSAEPAKPAKPADASPGTKSESPSASARAGATGAPH